MPGKGPSSGRVHERAHQDEHVRAVERAMVAIRRSQTRRALTRLAEGRDDGGGSGVVAGSAVDVLDAIEAEQAGTPATVSGVGAALNVDQPRASKLVAAAVRGLSCAGKPTRSTAAGRGSSGPSEALLAPRSCTDFAARSSPR